MTSSFDDLAANSDVLAHHILSRLSARDLHAVSATSRHLRALASDDALWRPFVQLPLHHPRPRRAHLSRIAWRIARPAHSLHPIPSHLSVHALVLLPPPHAFAALVSSPHPISPPPFYPITPRPAAPLASVSSRFDSLNNTLVTATASTLSAEPHALVSVHTYHLNSSKHQPQPQHAHFRYTRHHHYHHARVTCTDVSLQGDVLFGTSQHRIHFLPSLQYRTSPTATALTVATTTDTPTAVSFPFASIPITAVLATAGGSVQTCDLIAARSVSHFVGPCSCPVTAVSCLNNGLIVAGVTHNKVGNGHSSLAVAWDPRSGRRLAAFGHRSGTHCTRSATNAAHHHVPVRHVRLSHDPPHDSRVALLTSAYVAVYDVRTWRCVLFADVDDPVAFDMERSRLAVHDGHDVHLLDFDKALASMPADLSCFAPDQNASLSFRPP